MKTEHLTRIRRIYSVVLSILLILAGICFISACLRIYYSGAEQPYTPETVAAAFATIAIPVYVCLVALGVSVVFHIFFPVERKRIPAGKQYGVMLSKLHQKADFEKCNRELLQKIQAQQKRRRTHLWVNAGLLCAGTVIFLCYALNGSHFHQSAITESMIKAVWILLACLALPFGYAVFAAYDCKKSILQEIELVKLAPLATGKTAVPKKAPESTRAVNVIRWSIVCIGAAMLVYGFLAGGTTDVLTKAVNICTECVGLG